MDDGTIVTSMIDYDRSDPNDNSVTLTVSGGEWTLDLSNVQPGYSGPTYLTVGFIA